MSVLLPAAGSVRVRETSDALVVEVELPEGVDAARLSVRLVDGVLTVTVPRSAPDERLPGFHPDASGV